MLKSSPNIRTIKINITSLLSDEDKSSIVETSNDAAKVFDFFVGLGNANKSTSYKALHHKGYKPCIKLVPNLPTALLQQAAKKALSSIKSYHSNLYLYNELRKQYNKKAKKRNKPLKPMLKKWEYKGKRHTTSYDINLLSLSRRGNLTTFSSNQHRIRIFHEIPTWFTKKYPDAKLQAGSVLKQGNEYFLCLVFLIKIEVKITGSEVVGLDRGIYNLIATSEGELISSKKLLGIKRKQQYNRRKLQQKGTRSAKRKLKRLSGREKRFMLDVNHCVSKKLANNLAVSTYVLEDLTGIRTQPKKSRNFNKLLSNWSFHVLEFLLTYKCYANGINVTDVDARYTSQKCSVCGEINKSNRKGNVYRCSSCNHKEHADINAAKNIKQNYLLTLVGEAGCLQSANSSKPFNKV